MQMEKKKVLTVRIYDKDVEDIQTFKERLGVLDSSEVIRICINKTLISEGIRK